MQELKLDFNSAEDLDLSSLFPKIVYSVSDTKLQVIPVFSMNGFNIGDRVESTKYKYDGHWNNTLVYFVQRPVSDMVYVIVPQGFLLQLSELSRYTKNIPNPDYSNDLKPEY